MGAGKTTVGHALSKATGLPFYDLDWYIGNRRRTTATELFNTIGEENFRIIERNMLHEVAEFENIILSCGGGTPCFFDNMDYLNRQGETFYLKASIDVLTSHLKMARTERPMLQGKNEEELRTFIEKHLSEREHIYQQAKHTINVDVLNTHQRIHTIVEKIKELTTNN